MRAGKGSGDRACIERTLCQVRSQLTMYRPMCCRAKRHKFESSMLRRWRAHGHDNDTVMVKSKVCCWDVHVESQCDLRPSSCATSYTLEISYEVNDTQPRNCSEVSSVFRYMD